MGIRGGDGFGNILLTKYEREYFLKHEEMGLSYPINTSYAKIYQGTDDWSQVYVISACCAVANLRLTHLDHNSLCFAPFFQLLSSTLDIEFVKNTGKLNNVIHTTWHSIRIEYTWWRRGLKGWNHIFMVVIYVTKVYLPMRRRVNMEFSHRYRGQV